MCYVYHEGYKSFPQQTIRFKFESIPILLTSRLHLFRMKKSGKGV